MTAPGAAETNDTPGISVLLPVYNAEPYLREAIESVLAQTFPDFELLAFDDGSTDGSLGILREFEARDRRIRVFSRENRGIARTLNELISCARGRYLARMDADDVCVPDRFEMQVEFLNSSPGYVLVGGWIEQISAGAQKIGIIKSPTGHEEIDRMHLCGHTSICHPTAMMRRQAIVSVGVYDPEFISAQDLDLWLRLAEVGKIANIPKIVIRYRLHDQSVSESRRDAQLRAMQRACENAWKRRGIDGVFEASDHWRPGSDPASQYEFALRYGWVAWNHRHKATWWTYAREALRLRPFALSSWRLLIFGFLKSPQ